MPLFGPPDIGKMKAAHNTKGLIKASEDKKNADVRRQAVIALGELGDASAVTALIAALDDADANVRCEAAGALGEFRDSRAVEPLIDLLQSKRNNTLLKEWSEAAEALGKIGDDRAIGPLLSVFKSLDFRDKIGQALSNIGGPRVIEGLIKALDWEPYMAIDAAKALDMAGWIPRKDEIGAKYWIALKKWENCIPIGAPAVEPLLTRLQRFPRIYQYSGTERKRTDAEEKRAIKKVLGQIGDARAVEPLFNSLTKYNDDNYENTITAEVLWKLGDTRVITYLIDRLSFMPGAEDLLIKIGKPAVEPLLVSLKSGGFTNKPNAEVLWKLGWRPGRDEEGARYWISKGKWDSCIKIGETAVKPLISALSFFSRDDRKRAAEALVALYQSGQIDQQHKQLILDCRPKFPGNEHLDQGGQHKDQGEKGRNCHDDYEESHHDGIDPGIDFPL